MWSKIKKILGILTDILTTGREAGLWSKKDGPTVTKGNPHDPGFPDLK